MIVDAAEIVGVVDAVDTAESVDTVDAVDAAVVFPHPGKPVPRKAKCS